jgi:hypothetical protein
MSIEWHKRDTVIRLLQSTLNQISQECFGEKLSVTDNGDCVTVHTQGLFVGYYDTQKLWDKLENYDQDDCDGFDNLWDYLDHCKYTLPENELKTDNELSVSEKRQVALVDWLLGEPVITKDSISNEELWEKNRQLTNLAQRLKWENLELTQSLEEMHNFRQRENKEGSEIINHLTARIYQLEQENKQLKSSQLEDKPEPKSDKKPTAKKSKFKLPENFADYQQECDDLIDALFCFYNIKKGKWNGNILQFILTPTDAEKAKHWLCPIPDKWKAGLYLQSGQWIVDKVNLSDPDEWSDWYMDIYDFADANDIEIS